MKATAAPTLTAPSDVVARPSVRSGSFGAWFSPLMSLLPEAPPAFAFASVTVPASVSAAIDRLPARMAASASRLALVVMKIVAMPTPAPACACRASPKVVARTSLSAVIDSTPPAVRGLPPVTTAVAADHTNESATAASYESSP